MILTLIDWILFIPLALCVSYLLVYAIASKFYRSPNYPKADRLHRIAVFFPAYREDKVIIDSVRSFLEQDYPKEMYDVYVISDHMQHPTEKPCDSCPSICWQPPTKTVQKPKHSYWPSTPSRTKEEQTDCAPANWLSCMTLPW